MLKQVPVQTVSKVNDDWRLNLENYLVQNRDTTVLIGALALTRFCPIGKLPEAVAIAENFGFEVVT